jgi:hypothetical protein
MDSGHSHARSYSSKVDDEIADLSPKDIGSAVTKDSGSVITKILISVYDPRSGESRTGFDDR